MILIGLMIAVVSTLAFISCHQKKPEVGTWINQKAKKDHWVFTKDGKTKWLYDGKKTNTFTYKITDKSPVCGKKVKTGKYLAFLQLTDVKDESKQRCYYINTLTDSTLSLEPFGYSTILFFKKKK